MVGTRGGRQAGAGVLVAVGLMLAACTAGPAVPTGTTLLPSATRADPGPLRTDEDPLVRRFPPLGDPVAVSWRSGTTGDPAVPGPSTYWIDAAVQLDPTVAAGLRTTAGLSAAQLPALPSDVLAAAGAGPWLSGAALDAAFTTSGFGAQAYLSAGDVVVIRAVGSGDAS
ncbi:hypothetical protein [Nakamurella sp.]|uniref:hypothetical protein n=1 Tax=Nakamurella sp. TaxID=1869182 RepID=UPI003B3B2222